MGWRGLQAFRTASEPKQEEKKEFVWGVYICVSVKLPATELSPTNSALKGLGQNAVRKGQEGAGRC